MRRAIIRMAHEIIEDNRGAERLVLVGIAKRGIPLAKEIAGVISVVENTSVPVGKLNPSQMPEEKLPFFAQLGVSIEGAIVVLVNDVLNSGRTVRAALDLLLKNGTPSKIRLAVLADKCARELPVSADYVGISLKTIGNDVVSVSMDETDGINKVELYGTDE